MYSIQELQGFDYLLKKISNTDSFALFGKELKLVIEINNSFWYGDFIQMNDYRFYHEYIDGVGDVVKSHLHSSESPLIKKSWETFVKESQPKHFFVNPFKRLDSLPLVFNTLAKIIKNTNINEEDSELFPFLLNANSIDGTSSLPFIDLSEKEFKLVSIIDITKQ